MEQIISQGKGGGDGMATRAGSDETEITPGLDMPAIQPRMNDIGVDSPVEADATDPGTSCTIDVSTFHHSFHRAFHRGICFHVEI